MIQNCEPILIAARGKTPTVPRRSLKAQLHNCQAVERLTCASTVWRRWLPSCGHRCQAVEKVSYRVHRLATVATAQLGVDFDGANSLRDAGDHFVGVVAARWAARVLDGALEKSEFASPAHALMTGCWQVQALLGCGL